MPLIIVVDRAEHWPFQMPGVELVEAEAYLTAAPYTELRQAKVFNLCRSYAYQSMGYYVSLLAEARGHRPVPSVITIQDMKMVGVTRAIAEDLDELIHRSLKSLTADVFTLSVYFGKPLAAKHAKLALALFNLFPAPLLRAQFERKDDQWQLQSVGPIASNDIPDSHKDAVLKSAAEHFQRRRSPRRSKPARYDLAILVDPEERQPPSDAKAIERFEHAAEQLDMAVEVITKDDYARLAEFDALFIRATTQVNHYTYRFARRAAAEGLVVIDDPQSISRCTNKVYLAEVLASHRVRTPKTMAVSEGNKHLVAERLGLPCVLKQPDSAFSMGVRKVCTATELQEAVDAMLEESELVVAQEFVPTDFDWRVGVIDRKALFVSKYHMARGHWQIIRHGEAGVLDYGRVETMSVGQAPPRVVRAALRACSPIGDGLYGVDLKTKGDDVYVIEVNDNPNINTGFEDKVLRGHLYQQVMQVFVDRIERLRDGGANDDAEAPAQAV